MCGQEALEANNWEVDADDEAERHFSEEAAELAYGDATTEGRKQREAERLSYLADMANEYPFGGEQYPW